MIHGRRRWFWQWRWRCWRRRLSSSRSRRGLLLGFLVLVLAFLPGRTAVRKNDGLIEQGAEFVERGKLAPRAETRVDGQHAASNQRRLHQQAADVVRKYFDRMQLGFIRQFIANFTFQARQHEPLQ